MKHLFMNKFKTKNSWDLGANSPHCNKYDSMIENWLEFVTGFIPNEYYCKWNYMTVYMYLYFNNYMRKFYKIFNKCCGFYISKASIQLTPSSCGSRRHQRYRGKTKYTTDKTKPKLCWKLLWIFLSEGSAITKTRVTLKTNKSRPDIQTLK